MYERVYIHYVCVPMPGERDRDRERFKQFTFVS